MPSGVSEGQGKGCGDSERRLPSSDVSTTEKAGSSDPGSSSAPGSLSAEPRGSRRTNKRDQRVGSSARKGRRSGGCNGSSGAGSGRRYCRGGGHDRGTGFSRAWEAEEETIGVPFVLSPGATPLDARLGAVQALLDGDGIAVGFRFGQHMCLLTALQAFCEEWASLRER